jgi:transcriptional regulator with XRE-family HTH domain
MSPGALIRLTREHHRLTQAQLALRAGTSQNAISRIERDEISSSVDTIQRLLNAMGERLELSVRRIDGDFDQAHLADSMAQTMSERLETARSDPLEVFRALNSHGVDYLIVGGVAVQAYGHVRTTQDVDVIVAPDARNLERLAAALRQLQARLKGVDASLLGIDPTNADHLRDDANFGLATRAGGLEVWTDVAELKGARSWQEMREQAVSVEVGGQLLRFAHRDDLIRMKLAAGRERDLQDIAALTSQEAGDLGSADQRG